MIDLRSDTLTLPSREMLEYAFSAAVGDAGRTDESGRSCDPSVNRLEDLACQLTGKEAALFMPSGTLGNLVALLTHCNPKDIVLIDVTQHSYRIEKAAYAPGFGQLNPVFYDLTSEGIPNLQSVEKQLKENPIKLMCVENTHNSAGGVFLPEHTLKAMRELADSVRIPIHMDGARLFNASVASGLDAKTICSYVDSVMFCVSKGLAAPMGSVLCGSKEFIKRAEEVRKELGGNLRQAGYMAAAGEYALLHNVERLKEDHERAKRMCALLQGTPGIVLPTTVQSNIIILDVTPTKLTAQEFTTRLKKHGLWLTSSGTKNVRILLYDGVTDSDIENAAQILKQFLSTLEAE